MFFWHGWNRWSRCLGLPGAAWPARSTVASGAVWRSIAVRVRSATDNSARILRYCADHLGNLVDDLADLVFADDQRRGQRQGIAGDAQHQVVVEKCAVEPVKAPLARKVRTRRQVDAGGQPDGADVQHV